MTKLAFDIGGTYIKYVLFDGWQILEENKIRTPQASLEDLLISLEKIVSKYDNLEGVGIACPGTVNKDKKRVYHGGALRYMHDVDLEHRCEKIFGCPVVVENDGKAAAEGELHKGALKKVNNGLVILLGTGVGGGIVIDGKVHRGHNFFASEVSYLCNDSTFDLKNYQNMFGYQASSVAMIHQIAKLKKIDVQGEKVFEFINNDDLEAVEIFDEFCEKIANQLVNINYILDVEKIVIGGGISEQEIVVKTIREKINNKIPKMLIPALEVTRCDLGSKANVYGCIWLLSEKIGEK